MKQTINGYKETQRFTQWWIVMLLGGTYVMLLYGFISQVFFNKPFGNNPASNQAFLLIFLGITLFYSLFIFIKLDTQIKEDGIRTRFYPIHRQYRFYPWTEIASAEIRRYRPIAEYGGWGVRYGWPGKGKAYNVSGKWGLQLEFKNGNKLLIGTKRPQQLKQALKDYYPGYKAG